MNHRINIKFENDLDRDLFLQEQSMNINGRKEINIHVQVWGKEHTTFKYALSLDDNGMIQESNIKEQLKIYLEKENDWYINQLGYAILNDSKQIKRQLWEELNLLKTNTYVNHFKLDTIQLEDCDIKINQEFLQEESIYSYHTFMFPFRLCASNSLMKELLSKEQQKDVFAKYATKAMIQHLFEHHPGNQYWMKDQMVHADVMALADFQGEEDEEKITKLYISHYNRLQYFNDAPLKVIYDMPEYDEGIGISDIVTQYVFRANHQKRDMELIVGIPEYTSKNKVKIYRLFLNNIRMKVYNTDVALLIFEVENKLYFDLEDVKKISAFTRRIAMPNLNIQANIVPVIWNINIYQNNGEKDIKLSSYMSSDIWKSYRHILHPEKESLKIQLSSMNYTKVVDPIKNLMGLCFHEMNVVTSNKARFERANHAMLLIEPIIDDRMFVSAYVLDDTLLQQASAKYYEKDGRYYPCENESYVGYPIKYGYQINFQAAQKLYEIAYVDERFCTCQSEHMIQSILDDSLYTRWIEYQTIQACTHHSFISMSNKGCPTYLINTHLELYNELACLVLVQRASILQFQLLASRLTEGLEKTTKGMTQKRIQQLLNLQERYIAFQNQILFFEVSPQEQAVELYKLLSHSLYIEEENDRLKEQLQCLYEATNVNQDSNFNLYATLFAIWTLILAGITFIYDSASNGENLMSHFLSHIGITFEWPLLSIILIVGVIFLLCYVTYKVLKHYDKK